jgi:hypothetical protein
VSAPIVRPLALAVALLAFGTGTAMPHPHSPKGDGSAGNRDHWIMLGEAVHGGFGALIALGIRHRASGRGVEYTVPMAISPVIRDANAGAPERRWSVIIEMEPARLWTRRLLAPGEN